MLHGNPCKSYPDTFKISNVKLTLVQEKKSLIPFFSNTNVCTKKVDPLRTTNVWTKCHENPTSGCRDISVWTKVTDQPSVRHTMCKCTGSTATKHGAQRPRVVSTGIRTHVPYVFNTHSFLARKGLRRSLRPEVTTHDWCHFLQERLPSIHT